MELSEAEDVLLDKLSLVRDSRDLHLLVLESAPLSSLRDLMAVGLDTNILKALRRDPTFAERLFVTLQANGIALIVPSQSIVEYWNNHKVFASDEWNAFGSDLDKLTKRIENDKLAGHNEKAVNQIRELVQGISDDLQEAKTPGYLNRSKELIKSLLESASTPRVSRPRFAQLAVIRMQSKVPPGFADEKTKASPHGDFFAWSDFLLGALCITPVEERKRFVWVTDETKPDWKTGGAGHPALLEEFMWVVGGELTILSSSEIRDLLKADQTNDQASKAFVGDDDDQRNDEQADMRGVAASSPE